MSKTPVIPEPSPAVVSAWARLLRAQQVALAHVEKRLKAADLPPLSWYDVMWELDRAGDAGLRPFELERRLLLPQYGLSRLLDRIAQAGYIERRACTDDARGQIVALTEDGRRLRSTMWPIYAAAIKEAVGARLTEAEADALQQLLGKLTE